MDQEEVTVEVDEEPTIISHDTQQHEHPTILENITPTFVSSSINFVLYFIATYGWFIVAGIIFVYYIYNKYKPQYQQWQEDAERKKELNSYDPDAVHDRHEAVDRARRRLQEKSDADVAKYKEKKKEKEDEDRQRKIQEWENHKEGKGYHSKTMKPPNESWVSAAAAKSDDKKPAEKKPKLRQSGYNPLMGDDSGASSSWRPGRRDGGG